MKLAEFIQSHVDEIVDEWEVFARTLTGGAPPMSEAALRDHAREMLEAVVADMGRPETAWERLEKSQGHALPGPGGGTAASAHGAVRHEEGFDLGQLAAEFRALRASVIRRWLASSPGDSGDIFEDLIRFNEAIDEMLAGSIARYSELRNRSRNIFIGMLGHDLRSPLDAISMAAQYLSLPLMSDGERLPAALRIRRSVKTMGDMIKDLLDYTRTALGTGIPIVLQDTDLGAIAKAALDEVQAANPGHDLHLEISGDVHARLDPARVAQVLSNLLTNALKYGAKMLPVKVTVRGEPDRVVLEVSNRGSIIPQDSLRIIFDPLVQLSQTDADAYPRPATSMGLGLFIARQIVAAHGGDISAASTEAHGTVFTAAFDRKGETRAART